MTTYGPWTEEELASSAAASEAVARASELSALSQAVKAELSYAVSIVGQQMTQAMQNQMESASKEIYNWGYQIYDGMTGKTALAASDKLRELSAIKDFDLGTLSIKLK